MLIINRLFELFLPIWLAVVNASLAFAAVKLLKLRHFSVAGSLLIAAFVSFVVVNANYTLINWSDFESVKRIVRAYGPVLFAAQVISSIVGSFLLLIGMIVLIRQIVITVQGPHS
jgi:hypothetical protein